MNHWAKHFENYDLFMNNFSAYRNTILYHVQQQKNNHHVLDDGCGTGNLILELLNEGHKVSAIDSESATVNIVKTKCSEYFSRLSMQSMDGCNLQFNENSFDGISSMFVIPFVENSQKYISEMFRVLKPNGNVVISAWTPQSDILQHLVERMESEFKDTKILPHYAERWADFLETSRINTVAVKSSYNTLNLQSDLQTAGFVNISLNTDNPYENYAYFITCQKPK